MPIKYRLGDRTVTKKEFDKNAKRRVALHGGLEAIFKDRCVPVADTDTAHAAINRSGLSSTERAMIAYKAKRMGLNEDCCYDPTIPGRQFYESRAEADAACNHAKSVANRNGGRPKYRLNPRHVQNIKKHMLAEEPSLRKQDQRELEQEIIDRHSLPE